MTLHVNLELLLAAGVIFLFGLAMLLTGWLSGRKRRIILRDGQEVTGTVTAITPCIDGDRYQFQLSYQTLQGQSISGRWDEYRSLPFCKKHPVGSTMQVVYLPDKPQRFVVRGFHRLNGGFVFMSVAGVGIILLSLFILFQAFRV